MGSAREGFALWSTGLSASGKTTLAKAVERELIERGIHNVQRLDGAVVRQDLTRGGLRVRPLLSNLGAWGDRCFRSVLEVKQDTQAVVDILHRRSVNVFEELDSAELQSHSVRLIPISRYVRPISCRCGFLAPAMSPNLVRTHSDLTFISSS